MKIQLPKGYGKQVRHRLKKIEFSAPLEDRIFNIISVNNAENPDNKTELDIARQVVKRGLDLGDTETALIRLRNFLSKQAGVSMARYTDDDDLFKKNLKSKNK